MNDESKDLFIGLDLGTSQSAIATSTGALMNIPSVVGFPKDFVARKLLKKDVVFGNECLRNKMSVDPMYPLENGVIVRSAKSPADEREERAARELISYLLSRIDRQKNQKVFLVVGAPAQATLDDKQAIKDAVKGLVDSVLIVSEPFLVAYGLGIYGFSIIVDIGAGTLDICRMHGTLPDENDQVTLLKAGNYIDRMLFDLLVKKMPNARISEDMAREIKEEYAYIASEPEEIVREFAVSGKPVKYTISQEVRDAVLSIMPDMMKTIRTLLSDFDPEYRHLLLENIVVAGCGNRIRGLKDAINREFTDLGNVQVSIIGDPVYAGAIGGLKLAQDVPAEEWELL